MCQIPDNVAPKMSISPFKPFSFQNILCIILSQMPVYGFPTILCLCPGVAQRLHKIGYIHIDNGTSPTRAEGRADDIERVFPFPLPYLCVFPGHD
jgi:hypothetical protein